MLNVSTFGYTADIYIVACFANARTVEARSLETGA
jgi:hypothetical protein